MSPGNQRAVPPSSGSTSGLVSRCARPPQSMHVITGSGSSTASSVHPPARRRRRCRRCPRTARSSSPRLPQGALAASDFELHDAAVPEPGPGEVLVPHAGDHHRRRASGPGCRGAPATPGRRRRASSCPAPASPGSRRRTIRPFAAGRRRGRPRPAGRTTPCTRPPRSPSSTTSGDPALHLGVLGTNGLTAYFGLLDVGRPAGRGDGGRLGRQRIGRPPRRPAGADRRLPRRRRRRIGREVRRA